VGVLLFPEDLKHFFLIAKHGEGVYDFQRAAFLIAGPGHSMSKLPWADTALMLESFQEGSFRHFPG